MLGKQEWRQKQKTSSASTLMNCTNDITDDVLQHSDTTDGKKQEYTTETSNVM